MSRLIFLIISILVVNVYLNAQSGSDDYWLGNGFNDGDTVYTNAGWFYDDGGFGLYQENQSWNVTFCSENGSPLTLDFSNFRTHFGGTIGDGTFVDYDYITVDYPGAAYVVYHDNTPEFSFTSQNSCITIGFISNGDGLIDSGWVAEIYALPAPFNNDPANAEELIVGNVCSPAFYSNKGAYNTTSLGSPPCKTYFGGDVWFKAQVPPSGILKIETFEGTLDYAILDIYNSPDEELLVSERIACIDDGGAMPSVILTSPLVNPGDMVYIRLFGEQAKSGLFGICASDIAAPVTGYTGPGGVGDSLSLDFWFRPEGILNASGNPAEGSESVRTWQDQSGNQNDLVQENISNQPLFVTDARHGFGGLLFDGADDLMEVEAGSGDAPIHWFAAGSFSGSQRQTMLSVGDALDNKTASISRDNDGRYFSFTSVELYGPAITEGQYYSFHAGHVNDLPYHFLELNGSPQVVDAEAFPLESDGSFQLGSAWDGTEPYEGTVSELIQYRKSLNQAQEIIVNNYLSAKFDIALDGNDYYPYQESFYFDVAGIGRVDQANIHTRAQSAGVLSISGADDLDDNEFILFGHDNGDFNTWSAAGLPAGDTNIVILQRRWRVALTGSPGNVTMGLSKNSLPDLPPGFVAYNILVDSDGDFSSGAKTYGPFEINSELVINGAEIDEGDYIAIAAVRPVVFFSNVSTEALEQIANPILEVRLNYQVSTPVAIAYEVMDGTAVQGEDYRLLPGTITIDPGQSSGNIVPLILDDDAAELPDEYFDVRISSSTPGVVAAGTTTARHTILNDDLEISIETEQSITGACAGSSTELTVSVLGTGPFNYSWSPAEGLNTTTADTVTANPIATTLYTVEVTDGFGLVRTDTMTVTVIAAPAMPVVIPDGSTAFCQGDSVMLLAPEDHDGYRWSTGATTRSIMVHVAGAYTVTVIDSFGCESPPSASLPVTVHELPGPPVITAGGPLDFCTGDSVRLTADGSFVSFTWNDGLTKQERYADMPGAFSVMGEDANGCWSGFSDTASVMVYALPDQPVITPEGTTDLYAGDSVQLTSSSATGYLWSPGGETIQSVYARESGDYYVVVQNEFGCLSLSSEPVTVNVSDFIPPPDILVNGSLSFCKGDFVTLSGPDGYAAYAWSDGSTGQQINVSNAGNIQLVVTNHEGVESVPSDAVEITIYELPVLSVKEMIQPLCHNDANGSITMEAYGGSEPYSYSWQDSDVTSGTISGIPTGIYLSLVEDENGCRDSLEVVLNEPGLLGIESEVVPAYCPDFSDGSVEITIINGGTAPYSVTWDAGETGEYLQDLPPGSYSCTVTDANGCSMDSSFTVLYLNDACFVVPEIITPNNDGYNDQWIIEGIEVYPDVTIEVYDRWGKRVFYSEGHDSYFDGTFNGRELPMESYHYVIDLHNGSPRLIGNLTIIR